MIWRAAQEALLFSLNVKDNQWRSVVAETWQGIQENSKEMLFYCVFPYPLHYLYLDDRLPEEIRKKYIIHHSPDFKLSKSTKLFFYLLLGKRAVILLSEDVKTDPGDNWSIFTMNIKNKYIFL